MKNICVSAQDCGRNELIWLTELLRQNRDLEVVFSYDHTRQEKKQEMSSNQLNSLLLRLGVKPNLKGYQYLKTAVLIGLENREELDGITKRLYPSIARKHKTGADKVEHAIRHAISSSWERGMIHEQVRILGYHAGEGRRPTNSEFIIGLIDFIETGDVRLFS